MTKFPSDQRQIEVCSPAKTLPAFLNRQYILLLSAVGVPNRVFIELQQSYMKVIDELGSQNLVVASKAMEFLVKLRGSKYVYLSYSCEIDIF